MIHSPNLEHNVYTIVRMYKYVCVSMCECVSEWGREGGGREGTSEFKMYANLPLPLTNMFNWD